MALPKQIQKQQKVSKEIEEQIRKEQEENNPDTTQSEIDQLLTEVDPQDPPADNVTELHPKPTEQDDEGGEPASPPQAEPKPERTDWKQKYSVLKGKYDAEVPRLSQDVRDANAKIADLEAKIDDLAKPQEPAPEPVSEITPEEVADYGEDMLNVIAKKAREVASNEFEPLIADLKGQISTLETQLGQTRQSVHKQEQNEVFAQLDRNVKDWRDINTSPEFHVWLEKLDPYTGQQRKALLLDAFEANNAQRVEAFFSGYMQENAAVIPDPAADNSSGQGADDATLDLGDYVAPGTPRSGGQNSAPNEKNQRMWKQSEVASFYSSVHKGHYKDRAEDKARIEADIVNATREGRVIPG